MNANLMLSVGMQALAEDHSVIILKLIDFSMMKSKLSKLFQLQVFVVALTAILMIFVNMDVQMQLLASIISNFAIILTWFKYGMRLLNQEI